MKPEQMRRLQFIGEIIIGAAIAAALLAFAGVVTLLAEIGSRL